MVNGNNSQIFMQLHNTSISLLPMHRMLIRVSIYHIQCVMMGEIQSGFYMGCQVQNKNESLGT